eukprot:6482378-Amphidinium_carterae.1
MFWVSTTTEDEHKRAAEIASEQSMLSTSMSTQLSSNCRFTARSTMPRILADATYILSKGSSLAAFDARNHQPATETVWDIGNRNKYLSYDSIPQK